MVILYSMSLVEFLSFSMLSFSRSILSEALIDATKRFKAIIAIVWIIINAEGIYRLITLIVTMRKPTAAP